VFCFLAALVFVATVILSGHVEAQSAQWPKHLSWSSPSGSKWVTAVGLTALVQKYTGVSSTAMGPTGGTKADLNNLKSGNAEVAWCSNPSAHQAWTGTGPYQKEGPQRYIRAFSGGYLAYWYIVASKKSGIMNFSDLKGRKWGGDVMIGSDVTDQVRDGLLEIHGMKRDDYKSYPITKFSECVAMLKEGRADAVSFFGAIPSPQALELVSSMDVSWVTITPEAASKVASVMPGHGPVTIPAGTYKGQPAFTVVGHYTIPIVQTNLNEEVVYGIMKAMFDHPQEMEAIHPSLKDFARKPVSASVAVPYHAGAIRYYKEKGMWTSEMEELQKRLLSGK
ncbi:MAG: TAXI family TRAP transporter solute-binding subunit, partial [Pseudomonadota bacterium]